MIESEKVWALLPETHLSHLDVTDQQILLLRVLFHDNEMVGQQVGLSTSAVQRRVRRISELLAVQFSAEPEPAATGAWSVLHRACCLADAAGKARERSPHESLHTSLDIRSTG